MIKKADHAGGATDPARLRPWFFVVVVCILGAAAVFGMLTFDEPSRTWSANEITQEFMKLEPHALAQIDEPPSLTTKYGLISMSASYLDPLPYDEVLRHYQVQFERGGWRRIQDGGTERAAFCKPNLLARLENRTAKKPLASRVQVAISSSSESTRVCP
jgi:hypothetical protein